jgi:polar amino acid transport system substrate-binding protein
MMKKLTLTMSVFLIICSTQAIAESVKISTLNWGYYVGETLADNGPHAVIVREAFKEVGKRVEFSFYPWKRAHNNALTKKTLLISASDTKERREIFFYSEPYDNAASYLIGLKKNTFKFNGNVESLKNYSIGVLSGHYLVKMLQDAGVNDVIEVSNDIQNIKMLFAGRFDFIAVSKKPATAIINNVPSINGTVEQVVFYNPPLRENPVHLIAHKDMAKSKEIISAFNKGLQIIKDNGTYDLIIKKYDLF